MGLAASIRVCPRYVLVLALSALARCSGGDAARDPGAPPDATPAPACPVEALVPAAGGACGPCGRPCGGADGCATGACRPPVDDAPRLIAPASLGRVTSRQPTFRWVLPAGADGARVQVCRDRACSDIVEAADARGTVLRSAAPLRPGVYFWRAFGQRQQVTSDKVLHTWEFVVRARGAMVDTTLGRIHDLNGDGYADAVVRAAPDRPAGVFLGGTGGLSLTPALVLSPPDTTTQQLVQDVGDLDGDGFGGLVALVATPGTTAPRQVLWYRGGPGGPGGPLPLTSTGPWAAIVTGAGDLDGDGYSDLLGIDPGRAGAQVRVWFGMPGGVDARDRTLLTGATVDGLGSSVSTQADANGDGRPDLLLGAPADGAGRALLWINSSADRTSRTTALASTPAASSPPGRFGDAVAAWGDFDGDGYSDSAIAAPYSGGPGLGRMAVYAGSAAGVDPAAQPRTLAFTGTQTENLRPTIADLNGDGYDDLVVWMHNDPPGPTIQLFYGGAAGVPAAPARTVSALDFGETTDNALAVTGLGDTDRDGYDDLLVTLLPGQVLVARGGRGGLAVAPAPLLRLP